MNCLFLLDEIWISSKLESQLVKQVSKKNMFDPKNQKIKTYWSRWLIHCFIEKYCSRCVCCFWNRITNFNFQCSQVQSISFRLNSIKISNKKIKNQFLQINFLAYHLIMNPKFSMNKSWFSLSMHHPCHTNSQYDYELQEYHRCNSYVSS